ncbi:MAG: hypothetical protein AAGJ34_03755 [Pseudomonadota bacterium]
MIRSTLPALIVMSAGGMALAEAPEFSHITLEFMANDLRNDVFDAEDEVFWRVNGGVRFGPVLAEVDFSRETVYDRDGDGSEDADTFGFGLGFQLPQARSSAPDIVLYGEYGTAYIRTGGTDVDRYAIGFDVQGAWYAYGGHWERVDLTEDGAPDDDDNIGVWARFDTPVFGLTTEVAYNRFDNDFLPVLDVAFLEVAYVVPTTQLQVFGEVQRLEEDGFVDTTLAVGLRYSFGSGTQRATTKYGWKRFAFNL